MIEPHSSPGHQRQSAAGLPGILSHHWAEAAPLAPPANLNGVSSPGDELQAIVIHPRHRLAVINGKTVEVGHDVAWNGESWTVDSIESKCVVLSQHDGERQIGLIIRTAGTSEATPTPRSSRKPDAAAPALLPHAESALRRNTLR